MKQESWLKRIGKSGWEYLTADGTSDPEVVADILTRAYELGWRGPENAPVINPKGTAVLWKGENNQKIPVLTSEGLIEFYSGKGHRWFVLRMDQLLRGCSGPNAARLQEVFANYEEQCKSDGVVAVPEWLDHVCIVGGEGENKAIDADKLVAGLLNG